MDTAGFIKNRTRNINHPKLLFLGNYNLEKLNFIILMNKLLYLDDVTCCVDDGPTSPLGPGGPRGPGGP